MVVGAVAEVGEDVLLFGERRLADPRHAFAAHVRELAGPAVHPDRHDVAADARRRAAAFGHAWSTCCAGSPSRSTGWRTSSILGFASAFSLALMKSTRARSSSMRARMQVEALDALGDHARDHRRRELAGGGQQPVAVRAHPFALLVELADDARAHVVAPVVELLLQLVLDDLPLLLDDEDLLQAFGELAHAFGLERPGHRDLVDADARSRPRRCSAMPRSSSAWRTSR